MLIERAVCHSLLAIYKGTPISEQDVTTLDSLSSLGREPAPRVSSIVATLRCYLLHHAGAFKEAKEAAHQSIRDAVTARSAISGVFQLLRARYDLGYRRGDVRSIWLFPNKHNTHAGLRFARMSASPSFVMHSNLNSSMRWTRTTTRASIG